MPNNQECSPLGERAFEPVEHNLDLVDEFGQFGNHLAVPRLWRILEGYLELDIAIHLRLRVVDPKGERVDYCAVLKRKNPFVDLLPNERAVRSFVGQVIEKKPTTEDVQASMFIFDIEPVENPQNLMLRWGDIQSVARLNRINECDCRGRDTIKLPLLGVSVLGGVADDRKFEFRISARPSAGGERDHLTYRVVESTPGGVNDFPADDANHWLWRPAAMKDDLPFAAIGVLARLDYWWCFLYSRKHTSLYVLDMFACALDLKTSLNKFRQGSILCREMATAFRDP